MAKISRLFKSLLPFLILILKSIFTKERVIAFLKGHAVKFALKKILGSGMVVGLKGWAIKYIVTELFEEVAEPIIKYTFRKINYEWEVKKGEHILRRIEGAENIDDWRDAVTKS